MISAPVDVAAPASVVVRPVRPDDAAALERFYADLSVDSRWYRFMGATRGLTHTQSVAFSTPDHEHREGFVAVAGGRPAKIIGHLCLEPDGQRSAEVAIAVADAWQHLGIGRRLMRAGLAWAHRAGIERFTATMSPSNVAIHRLLTGLGLPYRIRDSGSVSSIVIDVEPVVRQAA